MQMLLEQYDTVPDDVMNIVKNEIKILDKVFPSNIDFIFKKHNIDNLPHNNVSSMFEMFNASYEDTVNYLEVNIQYENFDPCEEITFNENVKICMN